MPPRVGMWLDDLCQAHRVDRREVHNSMRSAYADGVELTRRGFLGLATLVLAGCEPLVGPSSLHDLVLVTREGCVHADIMRERLDAALGTLGWPRDYQVIDAGHLSSTDPRNRYPSPTLLYKNRDIFGMSGSNLANPEST